MTFKQAAKILRSYKDKRRKVFQLKGVISIIDRVGDVHGQKIRETPGGKGTGDPVAMWYEVCEKCRILLKRYEGIIHVIDALHEELQRKGRNDERHREMCAILECVYMAGETLSDYVYGKPNRRTLYRRNHDLVQLAQARLSQMT